MVPSSLRSDPAASDDPALAQIAAAWVHLPEAIKAGILAMVHAAGGADA